MTIDWDKQYDLFNANHTKRPIILIWYVSNVDFDLLLEKSYMAYYK